MVNGISTTNASLGTFCAGCFLPCHLLLFCLGSDVAEGKKDISPHNCSCFAADFECLLLARNAQGLCACWLSAFKPPEEA